MRRAAGSAPVAAGARETRAPEAERRLVSILFADLVGFTTLSESRDPEEVRELLSRYFDTSRRVIGRYGGTVEKFIGDAVMAVWGAPVALEDDAERAVRAALDLVGEVAALGADAGLPGLRLRAGVVTGETAVTVGAEGQGMVAGDLVNTASRVQSVAEPGRVLVGEATRRLAEAAIAFEDAGEHELKGRAEPVHLWCATRVVATLGGEGRSANLEAPFVGREAELRMAKELFHASADEHTSRVLSVIGVAGIGKSRLVWEFEKYIDALVADVWWHRGRCLSYGEGVAYWALAEMVRSRAGIVEEEEPVTALEKLRACVERHVGDPDERAWIEPRLAHLLGLAERRASDQEDLFSAWRRLFELLAAERPLVAVFEDLHWADTGLLDFVEYLLEWSRDFPIFVITVARPELLERRATWGAGRRSFHSMVLEPLPEEAREELIDGLAPGLPADVREQIRERAEGVPLYAVETVRMLVDRGLLVRQDGAFRVAGPLESLEVPDTLHALIAARLDSLEPSERQLLGDASVLGRTFAHRALATVSGHDAGDLGPILDGLVRKEILTVNSDFRSPERGHYGFLHALLQRVAYDTLSKRERKARHLAVAAYLETTPTDDEVVEVVAAHYLDAYRAVPDDEDADGIRAKACERLERAAERAASLAATEEAQRYFEQAAELAASALDTARLLERTAEAARANARYDEARAHLEAAIELHDAEGDTHSAARASARLAFLLQVSGHLDQGLSRVEEAFALLGTDVPDAGMAATAAELGRLYGFAGDLEKGIQWIELALETAEALFLPEVLSQALNSKALIIERRPHESRGLMELALRIALDHGLDVAALRAYNNLGYLSEQQDRFEDAIQAAEEGLALARRRGDRAWEWPLLRNWTEFVYLAGDWDAATAAGAGFPETARQLTSEDFPADALIRIHVERGELEAALSYRPLLARWSEFADLQERGRSALDRAVLFRAEGLHEEAFEAARDSIDSLMTVGIVATAVEALAEAADAAIALHEPELVVPLLERFVQLAPGRRSGRVNAQIARARARLAAHGGDSARAEASFKTALGHFREIAMPFWLAVTLVEYGEWLAAQDRAAEAEPLLEEARGIFERLRAGPWLERIGVDADRSAAV